MEIGLFNMNSTINDLLVLKQLRKSVKLCKEYDGYSSDEMLERFINSNGFNPIEELKVQKKRMMKKYCDKEIRKEIEHFQKTRELNVERLMLLERLIRDKENYDITHKSLILELFRTVEV